MALIKQISHFGSLNSLQVRAREFQERVEELLNQDETLEPIDVEEGPIRNTPPNLVTEEPAPEPPAPAPKDDAAPKKKLGFKKRSPVSPKSPGGSKSEATPL